MTINVMRYNDFTSPAPGLKNIAENERFRPAQAGVKIADTHGNTAAFPVFARSDQEPNHSGCELYHEH